MARTWQPTISTVYVINIFCLLCPPKRCFGFLIQEKFKFLPWRWSRRVTTYWPSPWVSPEPSLELANGNINFDIDMSCLSWSGDIRHYRYCCNCWDCYCQDLWLLCYCGEWGVMGMTNCYSPSLSVISPQSHLRDQSYRLSCWRFHSKQNWCWNLSQNGKEDPLVFFLG